MATLTTAVATFTSDNATSIDATGSAIVVLSFEKRIEVSVFPSSVTTGNSTLTSTTVSSYVTLLPALAINSTTVSASTSASWSKTTPTIGITSTSSSSLRSSTSSRTSRHIEVTSSTSSTSGPTTSRSIPAASTLSTATPSITQMRTSHRPPSTSVKSSSSKPTKEAFKMRPELSEWLATHTTAAAAPSPAPHHGGLPRKTQDLIGKILGGGLLAYMLGSYLALGISQMFTDLAKEKQLKQAANNIDTANSLIRSVSTSPVNDFSTPELQNTIRNHPELRSGSGDGWFQRGSLPSPDLGSSVDLPAGGELTIHPNQAFEILPGTVLQAIEDGSFFLEPSEGIESMMSGALQVCPNMCSEVRDFGTIPVTPEGHAWRINDAPEGNREFLQWRAPGQVRLSADASITVKPPGNRAMRVTNQLLDSEESTGTVIRHPQDGSSEDNGSTGSGSVGKLVRRHLDTRSQKSVIQFFEWNDAQYGAPPPAVGPKPPTTLHEYVALLVKFRAEDKDFTASLLAKAAAKVKLEQEAKEFVASLNSLQAKKDALKKAEADRKAKAEEDARNRELAAKKAKEEKEARERAKKEAQEKADAERRRKEKEEEDRKRKQEEEDRRRRQEEEERKRRQEEEDRRRRQEEEDKKRREEEEIRRQRREAEMREAAARRGRIKECTDRSTGLVRGLLGHLGQWLNYCRGFECYC